uniref:Uncharacterized protein n=1 Tax=Cannabis sativa TaxID=3483 RepID=A0A803NI20_CANSA
MLWKESDEVSLAGFSNNNIDVNVKMERGATVEGPCIMGDVNNVCSLDDKRGGHKYPQALIQGFNNALINGGLHDFNLEGYPFTWERGRGSDHWVEMCIDRAMSAKKRGISWMAWDHLAKSKFEGGLVRAEVVAIGVKEALSWLKNNPIVHAKLVKEAFLLFSDATSLIANKAKSTVYFGGISTTCKQRLTNILQMEEGSFPLKYLGVNLRPTEWRAADCGIIIDKMHKYMHTWASRNLSFTGRAQLVHSVLLGVRNYWMSLFVLPQKIMGAIDKCCRDFLWGSNGNRSKMHIPSWEKVCLPKNSGGLGFKEGKKWNISLMAKYIWAISSKQENLWVRWIDAIYL